MSEMERGKTLKSALRYAKRGWYVFPVSGTTKKPLIKRWQHKATTEPQQIVSWWGRWGNANIGVLTGRSGLVVVDIDVKNGVDGYESWLDLISELKLGPQDTVQSTTPSGGTHIFFYCQDDVGNGRAGILGKGVDVRAGRSFAVVPPSKRSAGEYIWETSPDDGELAPLPDKLKALLVADKTKRIASPMPDMIPQGQRNDQLTSLAGSMRRRGAGENTILAALELENQQRCNPPLEQSELANIAKSVARYKPGILPASDSDFDRITKENSLLHHTNMGNAQRMVALYGQHLRYCPLWHRWLVWNGSHWKENDLLQVEALAKETAGTIWTEATWCEEGEARNKKVKWAHHSESLINRQAMIKDARSEQGIPVLPQDLDSNPWLLNVLNGTLDLRTGELKPHDPNDLITKMAGTEYEPDAKCPEWDKFLDYFLAGNKEMIGFLQRGFGLSLTGKIRKAFFIIAGMGDNGKTTLVEAIKGMMGDYAIKTPTSTLTTTRYSNIPNDVARLKGARFIYASELDQGSMLDEAFIRAWTGQTTVSARFMRAEWFQFMPEGKMWLDTNHKPGVRGTDQAIWNRLKVISFDVVIPRAEQDPDFGEVLRKEYPGILAWAVRGCLAWQKNGLEEPGEVTRATQSYRKDMDALQQFIDECCYMGSEAKASKSDLFAVYTKWGGDLTKYNFGTELRKRGYTETRLTGGARAWGGIGLLAREED